MLGSRYHFAEGKDVNDAGVLVDAAKEVELDGSEARAALEDRDIIGKVDAMLMASTNVKRMKGGRERLDEGGNSFDL